MMLKWTGVILIVFGCGTVGFKTANDQRREIRALRQLVKALDYMTCELSYRVLPLPQLFRSAAAESTGSINAVLFAMARELDAQVCPDAAHCMKAVLRNSTGLPESIRSCLEQLGSTLGCFDLDGQLTGLEGVRQACTRQLAELENNKDARLRSYQTLGLCAGAALVILLL